MRNGIALFILAVVGSALAQPVRPKVDLNPEINGKSLDQWIKLIEDRDPSLREQAIKTVAVLGPQGKKAVPALIRQVRMDQNDLSPRTNAVIAIGLIIPDDPQHAKEAVAAILPLLNSQQGIIRFQAATTLGNLGPAAKTATGRLAEMIRDSASWEIRKASAYALGRVAVDEKNFADMRALRALADGIDDVSREVRVESLQGIINLGPPATQADQLALKALLDKRVKADKDKLAAIWLRVALMRIDAASVNDTNFNYISAQLKAIEPPGIAADAARALGVCGPAASKQVGALIDALKSSDVTLVTWAAWALGRIGNDAKPALPALEKLKESSDPSIKQAVDAAIKDINTPRRS